MRLSLRDSAPAVEWAQMRKMITAEWDQSPKRVLAHIDPEPVAAASIGQAYRSRGCCLPRP